MLNKLLCVVGLVGLQWAVLIVFILINSIPFSNCIYNLLFDERGDYTPPLRSSNNRLQTVDDDDINPCYFFSDKDGGLSGDAVQPAGGGGGVRGGAAPGPRAPRGGRRAACRPPRAGTPPAHRRHRAGTYYQTRLIRNIWTRS